MDLVAVISDASKQFVRTVDKNSPTVLTSLGVAGLLGTVILAVRATPIAMRLVEIEEDFRYGHEGDDRPLKPIEVVQVAWRPYIPAVAMGLATIACIVGSNHISLQRNAAIASLYTITERGLREYQAKVSEHLGEKKEGKIREEIAEDRMRESAKEHPAVIITGRGDYMCFDVYSKRWFRSNIEDIRRKVNEFNQKLLQEGWLDINYLYDLIGLEEVDYGREQGWIAVQGLLEPKYYTRQHPETDEPCLVLDYYALPKHI